jgi:hypothetical protein
VAFDYDVPVKTQFTHSMRLLMYPCFANVAFDAQEAIYYAAAELPAGTYWFLDSRTNKYCSFTTTITVPAGGHIFLLYGASPDYTITSIRTYASQTSTTTLETETATVSDTAPTTGTQLTPVMTETVPAGGQTTGCSPRSDSGLILRLLPDGGPKKYL